MHRLREAALCAVVALVGSLVAAASASASQPSTSLVLVLRPTSDTALQSLVTTTHRLSAAERVRRLRALVPDAARHRSIDDAVEALGLSVDRSSDWSVRVHGPATTVAALFGTLAPKPVDAAGRAYPLVPAALNSYVVAALPTSGRVAKPLARQAPRDGNDFRTAYSAPAGSTGAGLAVATVQLSGWHPQNLKTYAANHVKSFNFNTQYVPIALPGAHSDVPDGNGGDEEVALDQETILVTAPAATQVAYFAPNDDGGQGYIDSIHKVGADAARFHTAALSLSWGGCEASDDRPWVAAMDAALKYTLAAGVTVFAASGDAGSADCFNDFTSSAPTDRAVDYPASSPYVVAVGGTTLPSAPPARGWSGSGGGESTLEALPSWQYAVASRSPNNRRLVPDIASDADPNNGLCVLDDKAEAATPGCGTDEFMLAGTSLGSPTQAALLVDTLADKGWTTGVGDIHPALYSGAPAGAVTDITSDDSTSGNGAYHSTTGYDLVTGLGTPVWTKLQSWLGQFDMHAPRGTRSTSFTISPTSPNPAVTYSAWSAPMLTAPTGPNRCSAATSTTPPTSVQLPSGARDGRYSFWVAGVSNTPTASSCHIGTASVVLDRHAPTVALSLAVSGSGVATARWSYSDAAPSAGLQKFVLVATAANATQWTYTTTSRSRAFNALPRGRWRLRVTAYDNAGNASASAATLYDDTSAFSFGSRWKRVVSTAAYRRGYERANKAGAAVHTSVTGKQVVLYVTMCPTCGRAGVYDGHGRHLQTIDTYAAKTRYRVPVTVLSLPQVGTRTLVVRVLPGKNSRSKGHDVGIDAMTVA